VDADGAVEVGLRRALLRLRGRGRVRVRVRV